MFKTTILASLLLLSTSCAFVVRETIIYKPIDEMTDEEVMDEAVRRIVKELEREKIKNHMGLGH